MIELLKGDGISEKLKNKLWNIISLFFESIGVEREYDYFSDKELPTQFLNDKFLLRFSNYLGLNKDSLPAYLPYFKDYVLNNIIGKNYNKILEILEYLYKDIPADEFNNRKVIKDKINNVLIQENSSFRLFDSGDFIRMTNEDEIESVEKASKSKYGNVNKHLESAKNLLKNGDYRNSIKESLSAVEAICCNITGKENATLGEALKQLKEKGIHIHPALEQGFDKIYGYVSDDGGIRHKLKQDFEEPTVDDARYRLVSCSAFVNYLNSKK